MPPKSLTGVWVVTVDPAATPAGDPPPFESTLAYSSDHVISEITSRAVSSAGLGRWRKTGAQSFGTFWWKYRFDATGAYIGKTIVKEQIKMMGEHEYSAHSVTRIVDVTGNVSRSSSPTRAGTAWAVRAFVILPTLLARPWGRRVPPLRPATDATNRP